ncbi:MAG TPA: iron uptake porin, partial [Coleofasciculaceae cyanobacterium]
MISNTLWRSWLVSPAILGVALFTASSVLAQDSTLATKVASRVSEAPLSTTVIPEPSTDAEAKSATGVPTSVADLNSDQESSTAINTETPLPMAEVPVNGNQPDILEQINRYSNESESDSVELNDKVSPLEERSFQNVDSNESNVIEQLNPYSDADALDQVTNVTQLRDVSPGDWAFEALRSLVERYGCIAGYPDGTYRGNRAMTRYEFAAGLNACLQQIERLIGTRTEGLVTKEDLTTLQRLIEEFGTELAQLRGRVDALEARTNELERTQFSTTTKLNGVALFTLTGIAAGQNALGEDIDNVAAFGYRVRLNFDTSFTGKDVLRTRLQSVNLP